MSIRTILVVVALGASLGLFGLRSYRRFSHLRLGQASGPFVPWTEGLRSLLVFVAGQRRLFRFARPGFAHFFLFWGFVVLVPTILQAILEGLKPGFVLPFFSTFGPLALLQDGLAVIVLTAVVYGLALRLVVRPQRYEGSHQSEGVLVLCLIAAIMLSLLVMNGVRQDLGHHSIHNHAWQPISSAVGSLFAGLSPARLRVVDEIAYWIHLGAVLFFLTLLPVGKHFHVVTSLPAVFLRNPAPLGRLPAAPVFDGLPGVARVEQFPWRRMLDWYSCTECGRCQEVCPAFMAGYDLSPKRFIMDLRAHLFERGTALARAGSAGNGGGTGNGGGGGNGNGEGPLHRELLGDVVRDESLWACTTCLACDQECPLFVEHVSPIIDMRRRLLAEQRSDGQLQATLENLRRYGNSQGQSDRKRALWTKGVQPKVKDIRKEAAHTLWFVGDYASYNASLAEITRAVCRVFRRAGIDFGILYDAERNSGNDARRVGEEGLFELLAMKNRAALAACEFEQIVTTDPHSYNALKNEYFVDEDGPEILHYTELLDRAFTNGSLKVSRPLDSRITYHDPCYLGRYNGVYDAPRRVLEAIGCRIVEMPRNRDRSLCCGAGGGRIYMEEVDAGERPSEQRIREAAALGNIDAFVVSCPKDLAMYRDALKTLGMEDRFSVVDLIELVENAIDDPSPAAEPVPAGASEEAGA